MLHGSSGVPDEALREAVKRGVRKINYYTYAAKAALDAALRAADEPNTILFPKVAKAVSAQVESDVAEFIQALRPGA